MKRHKGTIDKWLMLRTADGSYVTGQRCGLVSTSLILKVTIQEGEVTIETSHSLYTLGAPHPQNDHPLAEFQRGHWRESL